MPPMHRLFVAIDFPAPVREHLALMCFGLKEARWMEKDQMHLTVRFIGEVEGSRFLDVRDTLTDVRVAPFDLRLRGLGHFPPRGQPHVVWAGVEKSEPIVALHDKVEAAVLRAGLPPEGRNFHPHVTLARVKGAHPKHVAAYLGHNALFSAGPFGVDAFHLYSSVLTPKGALHRIEASYPLIPPGAEVDWGATGDPSLSATKGDRP
jgi:RNA 2',3'-cyclic 3'-phosphodiesterase